MEIFLRAGFDVDVIGHDKPRKSLRRWYEVYAQFGKAGLMEERRGGKGAQVGSELTSSPLRTSVCVQKHE